MANTVYITDAVNARDTKTHKSATIVQKQKKQKTHRFYACFLKRFLDIAISLTALIVFSPIMLIVAIAVRFALGSPVIFKQVRPGRNGKLFYIYKFRSMTDKKDKQGNLLPDDMRVTKFSRFLRKTSLDELPQIFNILKGDMSLIGPRPRLVKDAIFYNDFKSLEVRPGMTGKSQVYGRNDNTWNQVFMHDADYSDNLSLGLDLKIFFLTFPALLRSTQSEKSTNKYYPDELINDNIITAEQYREGLKIAEKVVKAFTENKRQILDEEIRKFRESRYSARTESIAKTNKNYALASFNKTLMRKKNRNAILDKAIEHTSSDAGRQIKKEAIA